MKKGIDPNHEHLTPFNRCVLQNFPFIENTFDALTNYGLVSKIVEYLNNVIATVNVLTTDLNELENFIYSLNLHDYVDQVLKEYIDDGTFYEMLEYDGDTESLKLTFEMTRA